MRLLLGIGVVIAAIVWLSWRVVTVTLPVGAEVVIYAPSTGTDRPTSVTLTRFSATGGYRFFGTSMRVRGERRLRGVPAGEIEASCDVAGQSDARRCK